MTSEIITGISSEQQPFPNVTARIQSIMERQRQSHQFGTRKIVLPDNTGNSILPADHLTIAKMLQFSTMGCVSVDRDRINFNGNTYQSLIEMQYMMDRIANDSSYLDPHVNNQSVRRSRAYAEFVYDPSVDGLLYLPHDYFCQSIPTVDSKRLFKPFPREILSNPFFLASITNTLNLLGHRNNKPIYIQSHVYATSTVPGSTIGEITPEQIHQDGSDGILIQLLQLKGADEVPVTSAEINGQWHNVALERPGSFAILRGDPPHQASALIGTEARRDTFIANFDPLTPAELARVQAENGSERANLLSPFVEAA